MTKDKDQNQEPSTSIESKISNKEILIQHLTKELPDVPAPALEQLPVDVLQHLYYAETTGSLEIRRKPNLPILDAEDISRLNNALPGAGARAFELTLDTIQVTLEQRRQRMNAYERRVDEEIAWERNQQAHDHDMELMRERRKDRGLLVGALFGIALLVSATLMAYWKQPFWSIVSLSGIAITLIGGSAYVTKKQEPPAPKAPEPPKLDVEK